MQETPNIDQHTLKKPHLKELRQSVFFDAQTFLNRKLPSVLKTQIPEKTNLCSY
jgi:hypothetical protein